MTIEPPVALNKSTARSDEKMCPEGVAACPTYPYVMPTQVQRPPQTTTGFSPGPETPDQYIPEPGFVVSSPSSVLMYEQDVISDMQKSLLSPCTKKAAVVLENNLSSRSLRSLVQGNLDTVDESQLHFEDFEQSFNLERLVNDPGLASANKLEQSWGTPLPIDTGQKFKVEDVMTSKNINQGPTLAQLNDVDDPFEDIDSIIRNDPINIPSPPIVSLAKDDNAVSKLSLEQQQQQRRQQPVIRQDAVPKTTRAYSRLRTLSAGDIPMGATTTTVVAPSVGLTITVPMTHKYTTCTITSPAQEVPMPSLSTPPYKHEQVPQKIRTPQTAKPVFNYLFAPTQVSPTVIVPPPSVRSPNPSATRYPLFSVGQQLFMPAAMSTVDQPSLQQLLNTTVKAEPMSPSHKELSRPELHPAETTAVVKTSPVTVARATAKETKSAPEGSAAGLPDSPGGSDSNNSTNSFNQKWEEIKRYLETTEDAMTKSAGEPPVKKLKIEGDAAYNPADEDLAADQDFNSDSDSDADMDFSDTDSVGHSSFVEELLVGGKKEKRYFWQYNTQAKGPKGKRLCRSVDPSDPHVLNTFEDPVFDPDVNDAKYKHNGRARKGDGNDITPSPNKLYHIGNQLNRLNRKINEIAPPSELPATTRNKTRREKNKYASRACRLKKKAQHEANKIKLYGLDTEHSQLMMVLEKMKSDLVRRVVQGAYSGESMTARLEKLMQTHLTAMIAGNTADYVNSVLERVIAGDKSGGIALKKSRA